MRMVNKGTRAGGLAAVFMLPLALAACDEAASTPPATSMSAGCPSDIGGNECEYYMDGYRAGAADGGMGMSMVYERHDGYDSRFEPYFARGYEAGWMANR